MRVFLIKKKWLWRGMAVVVVLAVALICAQTIPALPAFSANTEYQIKSVKTEEKCIAITIDTAFGQEDYTEQILEVLKKKNVPATFAVMGVWAREFPEAASKIANADVEIISHSYAHEHYDSLAKQSLQEDAKKAQMALEELTGAKTGLIRVPYDSCSQATYQALQEIGFTPIGYSVDANKVEADTEEVATQVIEQIKPGDILVFQNNSPNAAPAIEEIIDRLKSLGYRFETVSGLLGEEYTVNSRGVAIPSESPVNS